jgi:glycosyltransferase involved in cell wall biosynthesis
MIYKIKSNRPIEYTVIIPRVDFTGPANVAFDIASAAVKNGWNVKILYLSGEPIRNVLNDFAVVRKLRFFDFFLLKGIVHSHGFRPDLCSALLSLNPYCIAASTIHGHFPTHLNFDYPKYKVAIAWWLWSFALNRLDYRICISKTMYRFYRSVLKRRGTEVAYNFRLEMLSLDGPLENCASEWIDEQRSKHRIVLLYAGSLISRKNVSSLVKSVLSSKNLSLLLCGTGPDRFVLESIPDAERRLYFSGHVRNLRDFLNRSDLLVLPSYAEGLPLVILEAISSGVPCLMSNIAVHRELASMGVGDTFNRFSFEDFCKKAELLAFDRSAVKDAERIRLWREKFSSEPGFARYSQILTEINLDRN